jgi:hypothetical protein
MLLHLYRIFGGPQQSNSRIRGPRLRWRVCLRCPGGLHINQ